MKGMSRPGQRYIPALRYDWLTPLYDPILRWTLRETVFKRRLVEQAERRGRVLMVGFMNEEAWKLTNKTGKVHYWSRKKKRIWMLQM